MTDLSKDKLRRTQDRDGNTLYDDQILNSVILNDCGLLILKGKIMFHQKKSHESMWNSIFIESSNPSRWPIIWIFKIKIAIAA